MEAPTMEERPAWEEWYVIAIGAIALIVLILFLWRDLQ